MLIEVHNVPAGSTYFSLKKRRISRRFIRKKTKIENIKLR